MSYIALARKWRPQTFTELLGQEHLVRSLENSLNNNRLHHAYLFTGTRGVGKTSVARLLAKSLNCEKGISANPCLECSACLAFAEGRFIDLIEIDGASKTKVEDTRELLENIQYAPTVGRFKIYLIDEVHMLSQHSFNALLKTLEEPPAHVKFLLATTDPEKLPVTVLSRCLQFTLRNVSEDIILSQLKNILLTESIQFEEQALSILSQAANGSMRDALSLLDQAIVGCNKVVNTADVKNILGYTQQDYATQIIQALIAKSPQDFFLISQKINSDGGLFIYVVDQILNTLHKIAMQQIINTSTISDGHEINRLSKQLSAEDTQLLYQIALKGRDDMLLAPTPLIGFEMLLIRMYAFTPLSKQNINQIISDEKNPVESISIKEQTPNPETVKTANDSKIDWDKIIPKLNLRGLSLTAAENAALVSFENNTYSLITTNAHESLFNKSVISTLENALSKFHHAQIKINLKIDKLSSPTPATIKHEVAEKNLQEASDSLDKDVFFKRLQDEFSAELIKNSIVSLKDDN